MILKVTKDGKIEGDYWDNLEKAEQKLNSNYIPGRVGTDEFEPLHGCKRSAPKRKEPTQSKDKTVELSLVKGDKNAQKESQPMPEIVEHAVDEPRRIKSREVITWKESRSSLNMKVKE